MQSNPSRADVAAGEHQRMVVDWSAPTQFSVPIPLNEKERVAALDGYRILDTPPEQQFDDITQLASLICNAPIAMISLVASHRQWFKSKVGITVTETRRDIAFCAHAILSRDLFTVRDAARDPRFSQNPLVTAEPHIRFYAAVPLVNQNDCAVGTLCVIDRVPRELTAEQNEALKALGRLVMNLLETRRQLQDMETRMRSTF